LDPVVSNSTPLIYLAKVGRLDLLKKVFGKVLIPQEVKVEVVDKGKLLGEQDAYLVEKAIHEGWIEVLVADPLEMSMVLDKGEGAALALAKQLGIKDVLLDEVSARSAARLLDLTPRGTVFVLLKALQNKDIDLDAFIEILNDLVRHHFRLKEEVYLEALKEARKIASEKCGRNPQK